MWETKKCLRTPRQRTLVRFWLCCLMGAAWAAPGPLLGCRACQSDASPQLKTDNGWRGAFDHRIVDSNPPATYRINDLRVGDLNGDGRSDIWTSGRGAGTEAHQMLWYRNPDWEPQRIAPGDFKYGNLGDIDGDGDLDVVVDAQWFENRGPNAQGDWPRHAFGHDHVPDTVQLGDVDADDHIDVVFATKHALFWMPAPANPRSSWPRVQIARDEAPRAGTALADLDGDQDLDVLWGNAWFEQPAAPRSEVWVRHMIDPDWPAEARGAIGDLDGDGQPDVVLSGEESNHGVSWYRAFRADGEMGWKSIPIVSERYEGVHSLALADFDSDGDLDLFAAEMHTGRDPDQVSVFENADALGRRWEEHVIAHVGSHNARVADVDGDGAPDIVGKNFQAGAHPLQIDLWLNRLRSRLPVDRWARHVIDFDRPWRSVFVDAGDIDGDDLPDVVTGGWWYRNPGRLDGSWQRKVLGGELYNMAAVYDFDLDGDLDVLGTAGKPQSSRFLLAQNDGQGAFVVVEVARAKGDFLQGARVARLSADQGLGVALSWHRADSTQLLVPSIDLASSWGWSEISSTTTREQLAVGDVDGDGDMDIHLGTIWLRNDGERWAEHEALRLRNASADPDRVELVDIDGDSDLDVVIGCEHASCLVWGERGNDPTEPWLAHVISADGGFFMSLDVGDIDHDGDPDVVVGEHSPVDPDEGRVLVFQNLGKGRRWASVVVDEGLEHHDGTRLVDLDRDGDLDIVSIGWMHGKTVVYENLALPR